MRIPTLTTERLLLKPLVSEDAQQIQKLYPRWEVVRYMMASVPWPYPENGAENYVNNVALPDMVKGIAWFWTIRNSKTPDKMMGLICLYDVEDDNRGFWLAPEYQGQGFMREASTAVTDYWFNVLNKQVLRAPKAAANTHSQRISVSRGMLARYVIPVCSRRSRSQQTYSDALLVLGQRRRHATVGRIFKYVWPLRLNIYIASNKQHIAMKKCL